MNEETVSYTVTDKHNGRRLDLYLTEQAAGLSRSRAQKLILTGAVAVNGALCRDKNYRVRLNDNIECKVAGPEEAEPGPEPIPLEIVFEDRDLLVVNKPRGMVVHPAPGHAGGTLVNALLHHCSELSRTGGEERPGIVHRLDKDTTGLLVVAKNDFTHQALAQQLQSRRLRREYLALVRGRVTPRTGRIEAPIGRHPVHRQRMAVVPGGREAATRFKVIAYLDRFTLLQLSLETGRTHQVRVHMASLGHPVAGDRVYGPARQPDLPPELCCGQALHARRIAFIHPRRLKLLEFTAPLPEDFRAGLRKLRNISRGRFG
jgi:23S rRNA pseudouridine1911/1915/1917 synthase